MTSRPSPPQCGTRAGVVAHREHRQHCPWCETAEQRRLGPGPAVVLSGLCGTQLGMTGHAQTGSEPCTWCLAAAGVPQPDGVPPAAEHRHFLVDGTVIGTSSPNQALQALLDTGQARELTAGEITERLTGRSN